LRKILARVAALYALTVTLTLLFSVFSERTAMPWARQIDLGNPVAFVFSIFALQRTYFLVDVPLLYMLLFLCAPVALALLQRGKGWLLLVVSGLVYCLYQVRPDLAVFPWPIEGNGLFNFQPGRRYFAGLWLLRRRGFKRLESGYPDRITGTGAARGIDRHSPRAVWDCSTVAISPDGNAAMDTNYLLEK
jgi:hypothetical protein